ncbi:MAG: sugar transferase [Actinomycetota bacterium]|nr:sugar transferase [Actinomycetota bacterium]
MAFEASTPEMQAPPRVDTPAPDRTVIVLPTDAARTGASATEGDLRVVWTPTRAEADVVRLLPRRARPPWVRPSVLVLGADMPAYLRAEKGFHLLSHDGLSELLRAPARRRAPIVAIPDAFDCGPDLLADLRRLEEAGLPVVPLSAVARRRCRLELLESEPIPPREGTLARAGRRAVDLVAGLLGTALTVLSLPFVALALWLEDGGPVFYRQERVGRGGRVFELVKFRSMRRDAEAAGPAWATTNDQRTTRVGSFLRRFKIDELPQFANVLLGHMSLVGPRPERPFFVEILKEHVPFYDARHQVRPGLTGWGTVKVGYGNSIEAKYLAHQFDVYHLGNRSLRFDLEILARSTRFLFLPPEVADRYML